MLIQFAGKRQAGSQATSCFNDLLLLTKTNREQQS